VRESYRDKKSDNEVFQHLPIILQTAQGFILQVKKKVAWLVAGQQLKQKNTRLPCSESVIG
jgi:hypothetical protein